MKQKRIHLTCNERDQIALLKTQRVTVKDITQTLSRSPSTISEELQRNFWEKNYIAIHAKL